MKIFFVKNNIKRIISVLFIFAMLVGITNIATTANNNDSINKNITEEEPPKSSLDIDIEENIADNVIVQETVTDMESENDIMLMSEPTNSATEATYGANTGTFAEMWAIATTKNSKWTYLTLNQDVVISEQLELSEGNYVKIHLNGHQLALADNAPTGKDRLFYLNGGNLEIVSASTASLRGKACSGDGGILYVDKGNVYIETVHFYFEEGQGKGKAVYVGKEGHVTFSLTEYFKPIRTVSLDESGTLKDYEFLENTTTDVIYVDGTIQIGCKTDSTKGFDGVLMFPNGGYIKIGDNAPDTGAIIVDSNYCGNTDSIKLESTRYPRIVVTGISNGFFAFGANDDNFTKIVINENNIELQTIDFEASYKNSKGTLKEMMELSFKDENPDYVNLLRDVEIDYQINLSHKTLHLQFNGKTLKRVNNEGIEDGRIFCVTEGSLLYLYSGSLNYGKSTGNGGAIYVGEDSCVSLWEMEIKYNSAKKGSAVYTEENGLIHIREHTKIYGNGDNDIVIYSKNNIPINSITSIKDGIVMIENDSSKHMFIFKSSESNDVMDTVIPFHINSINTPVVLTNNLEYGHKLLLPDNNHEIVDINGCTVLIKKGKNEASYTSENGDIINGSLEEMWNLAKLYGNGKVTLQTDLVANKNGSKKSSHTEWHDGFYQMVTGKDANITFDFNGHILDANMQSLIDEDDSVNAETNFLFLINDNSNLILTDSVGGGGTRNIISGTGYPSLAYVASKEKASHLILDNIKITDSYSGKGVVDSNSDRNDIIIKNNVVIKDNKKMLSDKLIPSSLSEEKLNLYINENLIIQTQGLGTDSEVHINGKKSCHLKLVIVSIEDIAEKFISDDEKYFAIIHNNYIIFTEAERMDEVRYIDEKGNKKITSFTDGFSTAQRFGGTITLLKDIIPEYETYIYDSKKEATIDLNGRTIIATGNNKHFIEIKKGYLKIIENNKPVKQSEQIEYKENTNSSFEENILTYYTSYDEQVDVFEDTTFKHTDNLNGIGGIKSIGYSDAMIAVTDESALLSITGGIYSSDGKTFSLKNSTVSKAYILGNKDNVDNNTIDCSSGVSLNDIVICGIQSETCPIIYNNGNLNLSNSIISNNKTNGSSVIHNTGKAELNIDSSYLCYNKTYKGGAIYIKNDKFTSDKNPSKHHTVNINKTYITSNFAEYDGGAIYIVPYTEIDGNTDSVKLVKNFKITNSYIINNTANAGDGGAIYATSLTQDSLIENCKIFKNKAAKNGGGIYLYDTMINIRNTNLKYNEAILNGGGIYYNGNTFIDIGEAWLEDMNINHNTARKGSGLYVGLLRMHLMGNIDLTENKDTGLYVLKNMQVGINFLESGKIPFKTTDIPVRNHNVIFAEANNPEKVTEIFNQNIFVHDEHDIITENTGLYLKANIESNFNGVLVQYYSYIDSVANDRKSLQTGEETGIVDLSVIDTSTSYDGTPLETPLIPHNQYTDKDIGWKYIWLLPLNDGNNSVEIRRNKVLRMIFEDADVNPENVEKMKEVDRFTKNNNHYQVKEVWVLKGEDFTSINPDDWEIHEWNPEETFKYPKGTVIRLVCEQIVDTAYENDVIFYDYDITDGKFYTDQACTQEMPSSQSEEYLKNYPWATIYVKTDAYGINHPDNYKNNGGAKFAFGNANTGVRWKDDIWISPLKKNVNLNRANIGTIGGCSFRMINCLDMDGNIVWEEGMDAPYLYDGGNALGKTTYADKKLVFTRRGDTYTLTSVKGLNQEMTELDKFKFTCENWNHTKKLYSNNFWPMDYVDSFGTDGHDIKLGYGKNSPEYSSYINRIKNPENIIMPVNDDSLPHNSYFGMQFSMVFQIPEEYCGPLEYWIFGDDEMYVFLDGELVCDIGGIHSSIGQYINLWNYIEKGNTEEHVLSFYYTERGASGSTCWMEFTAPNVHSGTKVPVHSAYNFIKTDAYEEPIAGAEFTLFFEDGTEIKKSLSNEEGKVIFDNLKKSTKYIIKETKTSSDKYFLPRDAYILEWIDIEWVMYHENDENKTRIDYIINYEDMSQLPDTGSLDAILLQNIMIITFSMACSILFIAIILKRKKK